MAFFAIELTQGPNLWFPNLHVTQSINRPQLGGLVAALPRHCHVRGRLGVRGRSWPSATAASGRLCAPPTKMVFVCHARSGRSQKGGRKRRGGGGGNGVSIEQCAQCLLPVGTTTGLFLLPWGVGGWEVVVPLTTAEVGGGLQATPTSAPLPRCAMGRHFRGPPCKGMLD